jgi:hypothetical protein
MGQCDLRHFAVRADQVIALYLERALRVIRNVTPSQHLVASSRARDVMKLRTALSRCRRSLGSIAVECRGRD